MKQSKPKLQMAPSPKEMNDHQAATTRLIALDSWTNEPVKNIPTRPNHIQEAPTKAWEQANSSAPHPYHFVASERLFQKIDFVWKRNGYKSMKEWVLMVLEAEADDQLDKLNAN